MSNEIELKTFPTLHARMGDWRYYITTLPFYEVARRVRLATELINPPNMNEWIQRRVIPKRAGQIADYLLNQEQHFFSSIVVGVYLGEPTWYEIEVEENSIFGTPGLDPRFKYSLGILELDGSEKLYAIDGQHRVAGIREALDRLNIQEEFEKHDRLANETLSILFVASDIDHPGGLERVRRLFTTLNKSAVRVSEPEIIALDEDDAAAIVTRRLVTEYDGLNRTTSADGKNSIGLIQLGTRHEIPPTNQYSVTTIVTLYRMIKKIFQNDLKLLASKYEGNRADDEDLNNLYQEIVHVWELLSQNDSAIHNVLGSDPLEKLAAKYRRAKGGHILFRPVGLQSFSGALGVLRMRSIDMERAVKSLCSLPMEISEVPWNHVVWNPNTNRMVTSNKPLTEALFLHMVGEKPRSRAYESKVRPNYNALYGDSIEDPFRDVPVFGLV